MIIILPSSPGVFSRLDPNRAPRLSADELLIRGALESGSVTDFEMNEETEARARAAVSRLLATADDLIAPGPSLPSEHQKVVAGAYSWWRLVHRQSAAVLRLQDDGYSVHEVAPLMRNVFNHAYAVHWLIDNGEDAVEALARAGAADREKLLRWLDTTDWPVADAYREKIEAQKAAVPEPTFDPATEARITALMRELGNVALLFERYGQKDLYPVYSFLSGLSHTSVSTASLYWAEQPETGQAIIRSAAVDPGQSDVIHVLLSLLQVDAAFSPLLTGDPLRAAIDHVLADMGWEGLVLLPERAPAKAKKRSGGAGRTA